tara:strand:+ start:367 stop:597 length:231 start_codon:yes stop_codon:yes gene_type:complete
MAEHNHDGPVTTEVLLREAIENFQDAVEERIRARLLDDYGVTFPLETAHEALRLAEGSAREALVEFIKGYEYIKDA